MSEVRTSSEITPQIGMHIALSYDMGGYKMEQLRVYKFIIDKIYSVGMAKAIGIYVKGGTLAASLTYWDSGCYVITNYGKFNEPIVSRLQLIEL